MGWARQPCSEGLFLREGLGHGFRSMAQESRKKKARIAEKPDFGGGGGLGGLYDFLPPPDPENDAAAKKTAEESIFTRPKLPPAEKTRVIFLDVDGVLLPSGSIESILMDGVQLPIRAARESDFAVAALGNLRSIVEQTGATIVLSSEWRRTDQLRSSIGAVLKTSDVPAFRDFTPIFKPRPEVNQVNPIFGWCERRAREIGQWLKDHPEVSSWVALDDLDFQWADNFRIHGTPWMKIRSVHTHDRHCLTDEDCKRAVQILLNPPPEPEKPNVIAKRARTKTEEGNSVAE